MRGARASGVPISRRRRKAKRSCTLSSFLPPSAGHHFLSKHDATFPGPAPRRKHYSPECVEVEFSEVRRRAAIPSPPVLAPDHPLKHQPHKPEEAARLRLDARREARPLRRRRLVGEVHSDRYWMSFPTPMGIAPVWLIVNDLEWGLEPAAQG